MSNSGTRDSQIASRMLFKLGAAWVQDFDNKRHKFHELTPVELLSGFPDPEGINESHRYVGDWIEALRIEEARFELATDVYKDCPNRELLHGYMGYRSKDHLMFYVLHHLRMFMQAYFKRPRTKWKIYSGGYNTEMNLEVDSWGDEIGWLKIPEQKLQAYFEFNDDWFCLKVKNEAPKENSGNLKQWIKSLQDRIDRSAPSGVPFGVQSKRNLTSRTWLTVMKWRMDLADAGQTCESMWKIIDYCGSDGILGEMM